MFRNAYIFQVLLFNFYAYTVRGNDRNVHGLISEGAYMYMYNRKEFFCKYKQLEGFITGRSYNREIL